MANEVRIVGLKNLGARFSAYQKHVREGARRITIDETFKVDAGAKQQANVGPTGGMRAGINHQMFDGGMRGEITAGLPPAGKIFYTIYQHHGTMSAGAASAPRGVPSGAYSSRPGGIKANPFLLDSFDDRAPIYQSRLAANATSFR